MDHLRLPDDLVALDHAGEVALEVPADLVGVRPRPAQEGRRLKGPAPRPHDEILGVQHDARQQGLRLAPEHVAGLHQILQQLRHQLRGGGCVGLVEVQCRVLNVGGRPAVVVDDRHPVAGVQQLPVLHHIRPVGVHHHQQGPGLGVDEGVGAADERVLVLRQVPELAHQGPGVVALHVDDDLGLLALLPGGAADARRRAHRVHVRVLVAHDVDLPRVGDQLPQSLGHDPALDLGALFRGLGPAAVELEVQAVLHHRLVAAPAEGHLDGLFRPLEALLIALAVLAHADGQGGGDAVLAGHLVDGLQNGELVVQQAAEGLLVALK